MPPKRPSVGLSNWSDPLANGSIRVVRIEKRTMTPRYAKFRHITQHLCSPPTAHTARGHKSAISHRHGLISRPDNFLRTPRTPPEYPGSKKPHLKISPRPEIFDLLEPAHLLLAGARSHGRATLTDRVCCVTPSPWTQTCALGPSGRLAGRGTSAGGVRGRCCPLRAATGRSAGGRKSVRVATGGISTAQMLYFSERYARFACSQRV